MSEPPGPMPPAPDRIARLFRTRWNYHYTRSKLRSDPVYAAMAGHLAGTALPLLDLGCGLGIFAFYLREAGFRPPIFGVDYDARKISEGIRIAAEHYQDVRLAVADLRMEFPPHLGSVSCLDILQYFPVENQRSLLAAAARAVAPGGFLLIRTGLRDDSWRYSVTRISDRFARIIRWMKALPVYYPAGDDLVSLLQSSGLTGGFSPLWGKTPFNNYLGVFRRPEGAAPPPPESSAA